MLTEINAQKKVAIVLTTTDLYERLPVNRDFVLKDGRLVELRAASP